MKKKLSNPSNFFKLVASLRLRAIPIEAALQFNKPTKQIWADLNNTEMISRLSNSPAPNYIINSLPQGGSQFTAIVSMPGIKMVYHELPFEWVPFRFSALENIFESGPLLYLKGGAEFKDNKNGECEMKFTMSYVSRFRWFPVSWLLKIQLNSILKTIKSVEKSIQKKGFFQFESFLQSTLESEAKVNKLNDNWKYILPNSDIPQALAKFIYSSPDLYVSKIRPFELAEFYKISKWDTLKFCLIATKEGFLNMSWDVLCPSCKTNSQSNSRLWDLEANAHCPACNIKFDAKFDSNVEVRFSPSLRLRKLDLDKRCLYDPGSTPHIWTQINVFPESSRTEVIELLPGKYRFSSLSLKGELQFSIVEKGIDFFQLEMKEEFSKENSLEFQSPINLTIINSQTYLQTLRMERLDYLDYAVTAAQVTSLQEFRDLFGSEVLRPGINLGISKMTILFSDLKDSTLLYEEQGDATAFALVADHFTIMTEIIRNRHGAIVKTIGDAIMAAFIDSEEAVSSALEILNKFNEWNRKNSREKQIGIKLGIHEGPTIALNLNDKLDYFGSTVNKAARIQTTSGVGELVISDSIFNYEAVQSILNSNKSIQSSPFQSKLKGIEGLVPLHRISLSNKS